MILRQGCTLESERFLRLHMMKKAKMLVIDRLPKCRASDKHVDYIGSVRRKKERESYADSCRRSRDFCRALIRSSVARATLST